MREQVNRWRALASRLGFEVITPATLMIGDESVGFTALLPQFGGKKGMIVNSDWNTISRHTDALLKLGYGFSAVEIGGSSEDESDQEMLRDWGWSSAKPKPKWW